MGYQSNPYGNLSSCDVYVQPSRWEGYAVTLMEAKVLHKVIVTNDVSGANDVVRNGIDGFICNREATDIARTLETLITDKPLLRKMADNAMNNKFSQKSSESKLKTLLESA